jgi:hypothetical protein
MKVMGSSSIILQTPPAEKPKVEFCEYLQNDEVKICLAKVEQELVDLKVLLSQIAYIKTNKDVS